MRALTDAARLSRLMQSLGRAADAPSEVFFTGGVAAPSDFIPELPGWRERSVLVARHGLASFFHYDFHAQALAKLERGHALDLADVREMLTRGLVTPQKLRELFDTIEAQLSRYPAIDPPTFRRAVWSATEVAR